MSKDRRCRGEWGGKEHAPGGVFAESWAHDPKSMDTNFALVPGQQVYIKIIDLTSWASSVSVSKNF